MHLAFSFPRVLMERLPLGSCFHTGRFDGPPRGKPLGLPQNNSEGIVKLGAVGDNRPMESLYRRHRFPPEIISHGVWLYHHFTLSFRDVEDLLAERGVSVSYESLTRF
jgi:hypothetical protein